MASHPKINGDVRAHTPTTCRLLYNIGTKKSFPPREQTNDTFARGRNAAHDAASFFAASAGQTKSQPHDGTQPHLSFGEPPVAIDRSIDRVRDHFRHQNAAVANIARLFVSLTKHTCRSLYTEKPTWQNKQESPWVAATIGTGARTSRPQQAPFQGRRYALSVSWRAA